MANTPHPPYRGDTPNGEPMDYAGIFTSDLVILLNSTDEESANGALNEIIARAGSPDANISTEAQTALNQQADRLFLWLTQQKKASWNSVEDPAFKRKHRLWKRIYDVNFNLSRSAPVASSRTRTRTRTGDLGMANNGPRSRTIPDARPEPVSSPALNIPIEEDSTKAESGQNETRGRTIIPTAHNTHGQIDLGPPENLVPEERFDTIPPRAPQPNEEAQREKERRESEAREEERRIEAIRTAEQAVEQKEIERRQAAEISKRTRISSVTRHWTEFFSTTGVYGTIGEATATYQALKRDFGSQKNWDKESGIYIKWKIANNSLLHSSKDIIARMKEGNFTDMARYPLREKLFDYFENIQPVLRELEEDVMLRDVAKTKELLAKLIFSESYKEMPLGKVLTEAVRAYGKLKATQGEEAWNDNSVSFIEWQGSTDALLHKIKESTEQILSGDYSNLDQLPVQRISDYLFNLEPAVQNLNAFQIREIEKSKKELEKISLIKTWIELKKTRNELSGKKIGGVFGFLGTKIEFDGKTPDTLNTSYPIDGMELVFNFAKLDLEKKAKKDEIAKKLNEYLDGLYDFNAQIMGLNLRKATPEESAEEEEEFFRSSDEYEAPPTEDRWETAQLDQQERKKKRAKNVLKNAILATGLATAASTMIKTDHGYSGEYDTERNVLTAENEEGENKTSKISENEHEMNGSSYIREAINSGKIKLPKPGERNINTAPDKVKENEQQIPARYEASPLKSNGSINSAIGEISSDPVMRERIVKGIENLLAQGELKEPKYDFIRFVNKISLGWPEKDRNEALVNAWKATENKENLKKFKVVHPGAIIVGEEDSNGYVQIRVEDKGKREIKTTKPEIKKAELEKKTREMRTVFEETKTADAGKQDQVKLKKYLVIVQKMIEQMMATHPNIEIVESNGLYALKMNEDKQRREDLAGINSLEDILKYDWAKSKEDMSDDLPADQALVSQVLGEINKINSRKK